MVLPEPEADNGEELAVQNVEVDGVHGRLRAEFARQLPQRQDDTAGGSAGRRRFPAVIDYAQPHYLLIGSGCRM